MPEKFVPFDEAVSELGMSADDLKKMMEEGKIRHFMDGGKVKFRRKDLDDLKSSLGIAEAGEDEISLAPPDISAEMPALDADQDEVPPPPPPVEEEFAIEPLDEDTKKPSFAAMSSGKAEAIAQAGAQEEEVASLDDFAISSSVEEEGQELSGEEAELLAIQSPVRALEEAPANVGMSVLLIAGAVILAVCMAILMSFPAGINPFTFLTDMFAGK